MPAWWWTQLTPPVLSLETKRTWSSSDYEALFCPAPRGALGSADGVHGSDAIGPGAGGALGGDRQPECAQSAHLADSSPGRAGYLDRAVEHCPAGGAIPAGRQAAGAASLTA